MVIVDSGVPRLEDAHRRELGLTTGLCVDGARAPFLET